MCRLRRVRRSPALILLLLLAVTFGPMLCRTGADPTGGDPTGPAGRTATTAAPDRHARAAADSVRAAAAGARVAVADAPKRCSHQDAPAPDESVPLPAPHRGEPLAPTATGPAPHAADGAVQYALARPPTGGTPVTEHTELLPVLRI
ncbi:hypothetical protein [Streptomyces sp. NPDC048650]|uniref:hypothetical protein n=1 Tax=unclassified Streptomyces TaxID=2593676 RepID=UPI0037112F61